MKNAALAFLAIAFLSSSAYAGKEEREFLKNNLTPAIKDAEAKFKESCGCNLKITLNDNTTKDLVDMKAAVSQISVVPSGAPDYCKDAESKKALCKMKTLEISKGAEVAFTFKGDKGVATHDGSARFAWDGMTRAIDK